MTWVNALLPVVTLVLGWMLSVRTDERRAVREREATERALKATRETSRRDRRETFELESLRELQEAMTSLARAVTRFHLLDLRVAKETGSDYGAHVVGEADTTGLSEELRLGMGKAGRLAGLVLDDELRDRVKAAIHAMSALGVPPPKSIERAQAEWAHAVTLVDIAGDRISERVREIYKGADHY